MNMAVVMDMEYNQVSLIALVTDPQHRFPCGLGALMGATLEIYSCYNLFHMILGCSFLPINHMNLK